MVAGASMRAHTSLGPLACCTSGRSARAASALRQPFHAGRRVAPRERSCGRTAVCGSARRGGLRVVAVVAEPPALVRETSAVQAQLALSMATLGKTVESGDALRSTPKQRAIMTAWGVLQAAALYAGASSVSGSVQEAEAALAVVAGFLMADLGSGVFHWSVDNYGDASTPALGSTINAFQGHHARPWTITQREFCNNLAGPCAVHLAPLAALCAVPMPAPARLFAATFLLFTAMAQQTHAWSHLKRGDVPPVVLALQDAGLFVSCRAHGAHHKPPFAGQYCIVSGVWNDALDSGVLTAAENFIFDKTGVAPRGWFEHGASPRAEE